MNGCQPPRSDVWPQTNLSGWRWRRVFEPGPIWPLTDLDSVTMAASSEANELNEIQTTLRNAGLRSTSARIAVIQNLRKATRPVSHAEVAQAMAPLGLDKATVFRNLNDLTEAGLLSRSELGDHVWRFELRDEKHDHGAAHPHFLCIDCGSVTCLPDTALPPKLKSKAESIGEITEILVRGHCRNCAG